MFAEKLALKQKIHLKANQSCSHTILYQIDLCCVQIELLLLVDFFLFLHFVQ